MVTAYFDAIKPGSFMKYVTKINDFNGRHDDGGMLHLHGREQHLYIKNPTLLCPKCGLEPQSDSNFLYAFFLRTMLHEKAML